LHVQLLLRLLLRLLLWLRLQLLLSTPCHGENRLAKGRVGRQVRSP